VTFTETHVPLLNCEESFLVEHHWHARPTAELISKQPLHPFPVLEKFRVTQVCGGGGIVTLHAAPVTFDLSVVGVHTHVLLTHVPFPLQNCPSLRQGGAMTVIQHEVLLVFGFVKSAHMHTPVRELHIPFPQQDCGQVMFGGGSVILQAGPVF